MPRPTLNVDQNLLSPSAQRGMALVVEADDFVPNYILSMPNATWQLISIGFRRFLDKEGDVERFVSDLEGVRQRAIEKELFFSIGN